MNNEKTKNQNLLKTSEQKSSVGEKVAFATGGFAVGTASNIVGNAFATSLNTDETPTQVSETTTSETLSTVPSPEEVLVATNEGMRVAQVNDNASFDEAFANARSQVGAGGVFEWREQVYNTYYKEEWNSLSATEQAEFYSKIDMQAFTENESISTLEAEQPIMASNTEMIDNQTNHEAVKVLGVEAVVDSQGSPMTIAGIEIEGEQMILVDVDNNGVMDVLMADVNQDEQISDNEIYNVSDMQITTTDLQEQLAASQSPNLMLANNDELPDYMNDANISSMA